MKNVTIYPLLKKGKVRKDKTCPIVIRILDGKKPVELFTSHYVNPLDWDDLRKQVKSKNQEAENVNSFITMTVSKAKQIIADLRLTDQVISGQVIKERLTGRKNTCSLLELIEKHNLELEKKVGNDYCRATVNRYKLTKKKVIQFLENEWQVKDLGLLEIKPHFLDKLETFLKFNQKLCHNAAMKHIKNVKKIMRYGERFELIQQTPFSNFRCTTQEVHREALTQSELDNLIKKKGLNDRLSLVRDVFVFSSYTGLAYSDVAKLNKNHIQQIDDSTRIIIISRTKTNAESRIPLLPQAEEILKKYSEFSISNKEGKLLPVASNQKMNEYLKEIASICDISKRLTTHLARHTFATTVTLQNGISLEVVQTTLGHKSIRTTQIYAKMTDIRLQNEMKQLSHKLKPLEI